MKCRVVQYELKMICVCVLFGCVLVFWREPEGGGWAPWDGTYKYHVYKPTTNAGTFDDTCSAQRMNWVAILTLADVRRAL